MFGPPRTPPSGKGSPKHSPSKATDKVVPPEKTILKSTLKTVKDTAESVKDKTFVMSTSSNSQTQRRSVGERIEDLENAREQTSPKQKTTTTRAGPAEVKSKPSQEEAKPSQKPGNRNYSLEAKNCVIKAKLHLNNSGNIKREIKAEVILALDHLFQLVKDSEADRKINIMSREPLPRSADNTLVPVSTNFENSQNITAHLEEHTRLLQESNKKMDEMKLAMSKQQDLLEQMKATTVTYANVVTGSSQAPPTRRALHSLVVTSQDEADTGEQVLTKVREAVDAKEGWVTVEKVRKAKDRKVIMSCTTETERNRIKERLEKSNKHLIVEDVKNKDPLLILWDVTSQHSDEDIKKAMRNQNKNVFRDLDKEEDRVEIKYRRKARNPHQNHVVITTSPKIWQRATGAGMLRIDLQQIRVADHSPLVQCSRCLGFGHSKRFCKETVDLCSHCGGPHLKSECPEWMAGAAPACRNCKKAEYSMTEHNAFSWECPVRKRWDEIARSTIAYC